MTTSSCEPLPRIAFVDIDGVLLPDGQGTPTDDAKRAIRLLLDAGFKIVSQSSWRSDPKKLIEAHLLFQDLGANVQMCEPFIPSRKTAIEKWLDDNIGCDAFPNWDAHVLIIDDSDIGLPGVGIIKPDSRIGVRANDVEWHIQRIEGTLAEAH